MIRALLHASLRHRVAVLALAMLAMVLGSDLVRNARVDAFPEFAPPKVEIQTEAPGLSALEVETLVTRPLEQVLTGVPQSSALRSKSVLGLSSVVVLFEVGTDPYRARQFIAERVALATAQLPAVARAPVILSPTSSTSRVLKVGLSSETMSLLALSDLARWTIRPRLMAIQGVANVAVWGERPRELQVLLDPERLRAAELGVTQMEAAVTAAVDPKSGGFVDGDNQRLALRHVPGVTGAGDLAGAIAAYRGGAATRIGDVADVVEDTPPLIGDAVINGGPGLLLIVEKQPQANTLAITAAVDAALLELAPALPGVLVDATIFRPASFIERAVNNLQLALGIGCGLVIVVLVVFLWDWRTALVSVLAIPLSLLAALSVLDAVGATLDTMVLAGLAIALGEVVDDAIIDVENIHRRLRQNVVEGLGRSTFRVVLEASYEVRSAVVVASVVVVLVFLPVYLLPGLSGAFFRPLASAYVLAIACSLLVALTVTPALSMLLLPGGVAHDRTSPVGTLVARWFGHVLRVVLRHPRRILAVVPAALIVGVLAFSQLASGFLPDFREQDFLMHWIAKPGTSVTALRRTTERVSQDLLEIPGVRNSGAHLGRAVVSDEVVGPDFGEIWVSVDPSVDHAGALRAIETTLSGYPGLYHDVQTYLREKIDEVLTGAHGSIVVRVYGNDLAVLAERAQTIAEDLRAIPGTAEVAVEMLTMVPSIEIHARPAAAAVFGLSEADIRGQVNTLVSGRRVGEIYRDLQPIPVVVWGVESVRDDVQAVRDLMLQAPDGARVRLADVADVTVVATPNALKHEGGSRRIDVTCSVQGPALSAVAAQVEQAVAALEFPPGHHAEVLGEHREHEAASRVLLRGGALAVFGIILVLYADFRSARITALVAASLPFALVGAVAGAYFGDGVLSLGSLVGFVTVLGIAARNGIMLVSHFRHLQSAEGIAFGPALVLRGTLERVAPILMTALSTGLALIPLAVLGDRPGHEIEHPMALVILGGLVTSTVLNLLVTPAMYLVFCVNVPVTNDKEDQS